MIHTHLIVYSVHPDSGSSKMNSGKKTGSPANHGPEFRILGFLVRVSPTESLFQRLNFSALAPRVHSHTATMHIVYHCVKERCWCICECVFVKKWGSGSCKNHFSSLTHSCTETHTATHTHTCTSTKAPQAAIKMIMLAGWKRLGTRETERERERDRERESTGARTPT
jgi:hypothetical protein